jgi:hypothetical protein
MAIKKKTVAVIVSSTAGTYLKTWANFEFVGFDKELNAGVGECVLKTDAVFDYGGIDLKVGNRVEIRVCDADTLAAQALGTNDAGARMIYNGYISMIEREVIGAKEQVTIRCLGFYTQLATDILKSGSQTTLYSYASGLTVTAGSIAACDVGKLVRAVLDRYIAENTSPQISYDSTQIPDTGTTATYAFEQKTYREALDILKKMAPAGTYYYVDETGAVKFKPTPTTPTHQFVFGRHFTSVRVEESMEKVRNFLLVWNGETGGSVVYKHYQDDGSIAQYGRRGDTMNDYGIDNVNAADLIGTKFLAENKDPEIKVICTIFDNNNVQGQGYDIESIQPGDTCSFYGFSSELSQVFRDNMLITKVKYTLDSVEIEVQLMNAGLVDIQADQTRRIDDIQSGGLSVPETYT